MADCSKSLRVLGLDLSDQSARGCLLSLKGEVVWERKIALTIKGLDSVLAGEEQLRVVLEVGTHSPWVSRLAGSYGHEVVVANPRALPSIYKSDKKSDRADAEQLARIARVDSKLLSPIQHRGEEAQADLAIIRARDNLVRTRSGLISHVKGAVKSFGGRIGTCSPDNIDRRALDDVAEELRPALQPVLEVIGELTQRIKGFDRALEQLCEVNYPETELLRQVRGVGSLTALAFVLILEDSRRFKNSRSVAKYLGLTPKQDESGEKSPQLRISKRGDGYLRRLLVSCAQYLLGPFGTDCDLRRWGEKIAARGGKNAKKRAVVAVARKLSVLLHALWRSGEAYEPLRHASPQTAA